MKSKVRNLLAFSLATVMVSSVFSGCSQSSSSAAASGSTAMKDDNKPMTLTAFSQFTNYQGVLKGWGAKILKDKFNVTVNFISPNVAGGGDTLYDTRSAAGDLGDIVFLGTDRLDKCIKAGLLYDMNSNGLMTNYGKDIENYPKAIKKIQTAFNTGSKVYAIPNNVSSQSATTPSEATDLTYGMYSRWDYYTAIGSPKLNNLDDLVSMLQTMQKKYPKSDDGKKTYAISLFKDWDGDTMTEGSLLAEIYGYYVNNIVEFNAVDPSQWRSELDKDSYYIQCLKFYYKLNRAGLLDPDSPTENWDTVNNKYTNGQDLFGFYSFTGNTQYNTQAHKEAGKGYEVLPFPGQKVLSFGATPAGTNYIAGIGSKCSNPARAMKVLDWLYSPDGMNAYYNGPYGLAYKTSNGKNTLTDYGINVTNTTAVPASYGGGTWQGSSINTFNYYSVLATDKDPATGEPYNSKLWASYQKQSANKLDSSWSAAMDNAKNSVDYYVKTKQITVLPGNDYVHMTMTDDLKTIENQIKSTVTKYSWKMIFASSEDEFNKDYNAMVSEANGLGADKIYDFDKKDLAAYAKSVKAAEKS